MNIDGVENGIVIDHIRPGDSMRLYYLLGLTTWTAPSRSSRMSIRVSTGARNIIKIDQHIDLDLDALGYIDPKITVNLVRGSKLQEKKHLSLPDSLVNIVECKNPRCITTVEDEVDQVFTLVDPQRSLYRCLYCEVAAPDHR